MASINLEKILEYRNIQEGLQYENHTSYYLCKGMLLCFTLHWETSYKHKIRQILE